MITRKTQKELALTRWLILRTVSSSGYQGATEPMVLHAIEDDVPVSGQRLRNEIDYLEQSGLIKTRRSEIKSWRINITPNGRNVVEYQVDCPVGIARPKISPDL